MNKLMKRTLSILTVIAMLLACLPVLSFAEDIPSIGIGGGMNGTLSPDWNVEIMVVIRTKKIVGVRSGSVIFRNCWNFPAPSSEADS